jgi:hypothetical protein
MACRGRYTSAIYAGIDMNRGNCRTFRKIGGWCRRLCLSNYLPAIYQFGVRAHSVHARNPSTLLPKTSRWTSIVDAIRALLSGQPVGNDIWVALAWCVGIILVAYVFAMRVYKKQV